MRHLILLGAIVLTGCGAIECPRPRPSDQEPSIESGQFDRSIPMKPQAIQRTDEMTTVAWSIAVTIAFAFMKR